MFLSSIFHLALIISFMANLLSSKFKVDTRNSSSSTVLFGLSSVLILLSGISAFIWFGYIMWPGLHSDAAFFSSPLIRLAKGEGWKYGGFLYHLNQDPSGEYNFHSILYPLIFGLVLKANTFEKLFLWSSIVNAFSFASYFLLQYSKISPTNKAIRLIDSTLVGVATGVITLYLQGRPEQIIPIILLIPLCSSRALNLGSPQGTVFLVISHAVTLTLLAFTSPLTSVIYFVAISSWFIIHFSHPPGIRMVLRLLAAAIASTVITVLLIASAYDYNLIEWLHNTLARGAIDPTAIIKDRINALLIGLNIPLELPFWNIPVILSLVVLSNKLFKKSLYVALVPLGAFFFILLKSSQAYTWAGFMPSLMLIANSDSIFLVANSYLYKLSRLTRSLFLVLYSLVFVRYLLLSYLYTTQGLSYHDAKEMIISYTQNLPSHSAAVGYLWMSRPSFVVMGGDKTDFVIVENTILSDDGDSALNAYEDYSRKSVSYIIIPQLGHIDKPPYEIRNGSDVYKLIQNQWSPHRAKILGLKLGGPLPGYQFALYKITGASN